MNRHLIVLILLATAPRGFAAVPADDGYIHLGVQSCSASSCHGSAGERNSYAVLQNEYITWARHDLHARAYDVLLEERSRTIAANLGLEAAHEATVCLDCHADHVPAERRGVQFRLADGVGCEACHGGAEEWLGVHIGAGRNRHPESLAAGLYPTEKPQARAALCLSCHLGTRDKFVTHEIMGAGHPRLSFDLQKFTDIQPRHYRVDADYRARKDFVEDSRVWATGQVAAARKYLALLQGPRLAAGGLFPELGLFDCHACHHSMKQPRWRPDSLSATPPGTVMLNDSSLLMSHVIASVILPETANPLRGAIRALHLGAQTGVHELREAAVETDRVLARLAVRLGETSFGPAETGRLVSALTDGLAARRFDDYSDAEQATMALDVLVAGTGPLASKVDALYAAMADEDRFELAAVAAPFRGSASPATGLPPPPDASGAGSSRRTVAASSLRVRGGADAAAAIVGRLGFGARVEVLEIVGDWARIRYTEAGDDRDGWVAARYLR